MEVVPFAFSLTSLKVVAGVIMEEAFMSSEKVAVTLALEAIVAGLVLITVGGPGPGRWASSRQVRRYRYRCH